MNYEVELKFRLSAAAGVVPQLESLGAKFCSTQIQVDQYLAHPVRDFSVTDEALRIRSIGDENRVTYKGPVVDRATKTRTESELAFAAGPAAAEQFAQIWEALGFRRVRIVRKTRRVYELYWRERNLEICLDEVDSLGSFLEIETIADAATRAAAQEAILSLAETLQLGSSEPRSYLEMLITQDQAQAH